MKLKDILNQLKQYVAPKQDVLLNDILQQINQSRQSRIKKILQWSACALAAVLLVFGIGFYMYQYFTFDNSVNIIGDTAPMSKIVYVAADNQSVGNVATNTTVTIVTRESMSTKEAAKYISVTPETSYSLHKNGTNSFTLKFDEALAEDRAYTVNSVIDDTVLYRWSLQTDTPFKVANVYPYDTKEVDVNTTIEITLSESSVNGLNECMSIYPETEGKYFHNGRTWVFTPAKPLDPYTPYTVTISGDTVNSDGEALGEDYVFSFTTGSSEDKWAYISSDTYDFANTFPSSLAPQAIIYSKGISSPTADMVVYRLTDVNDYLTLHGKYNDNAVVSTAIINDIKSEGFPVHSQFSVSVISDPENDQKFYFNYPKELESGYYVTEIIWNNIKMYQLLQVSDLAVYASAYNGTYTVWVNNTQTNLPVEKANVTIGQTKAITNENGIAVLKPEINDTDADVFISVKYDTLSPYIIYAQSSLVDNQTAQKDYYYYLYTNSSLYRTTDTVKIWGAALKRNNAAASPIVTIETSWDGKLYPAKLSSKGTFSLEIPVNNQRSTEHGYISLYINEQYCSERSICFMDYELPTYSLESTSDKFAYFSDESARFTVNASYYDDTPAANLALYDGDTTFYTDVNGTAILDKVVPAEENTVEPQIYTAYFETDNTMGSSSYTDIPVVVFNNSEYLQGDLVKDDGSYTLNISTHSISTDKINALPYSEFKDIYYNLPQELYLDKALSKDVQIEIHKITYEREKSGSYYDSLQKKIQFSYKYKEIDNVIQKQSVTTSKGTVTVDNISLPETDGYYYIRLAMTDSNGKECSAKIFADMPVYGDFEQLSFNAPHSASANESITLNIYDPTTRELLKEGRFIYQVIGTDILYTSVSDAMAGSFAFTEDCIPDVTVFGAYFDGTHLQSITTQYIALDVEEKRLKVSLTTDKKEYAPGETVTASITVTDAEGNPLKASYNINVADQALLQLAENDHNILNALYTRRAPYEIYTSLPILYFGEGGGGAAYIRDDFEDTPAFISGETDSDGKDEIQFELSDSITAWTLTAQAITTDVRAGNTQTGIKTTKDFFISFGVSDNFKTTDDAVIAYRCVGSITAESTADTVATLYSGETALSEQTLQHNGNTTQFINFGKLAEGDYTVNITSRTADNEDTAVVEFKVVNSALYIPTVTNLKDTENTNALILTDTNHAAYTEWLDVLLQGGNTRIDYVIGQKFAKALTENHSRDAYTNINWDFINEYSMDGGFSSYTANSSPDLFLTARLASLFPEQIDKEYCLYYFNEILRTQTSTLEEILCAIWGKAALGEAVENDLAYYYAEGNGFSTEQHLYFALAYAYSGNQTRANEIYTNRLQPMVVQNNRGMYLEHEDKELQNKCTAMLSFLLTRISSANAENVLNFIIDHDSDTTLACLEILCYLKEYIPCLEGENTVTVTFADASTEKITYSRHKPYIHKISSDKAITAVQSIEGETVVKASGVISGDNIIKNGTHLGHIPFDLPATTVVGDQILMTLTLDPAQIAESSITVPIPAGLRYTQTFDSSDNTATVEHGADASKLTVSYSGQEVTVVTLYFKAVLPGSFVFEPIISIADQNLSYYATDAYALTITANMSTNIPANAYQPYIPEDAYQPVEPEVPQEPSVPDATPTEPTE